MPETCGPGKAMLIISPLHPFRQFAGLVRLPRRHQGHEFAVAESRQGSRLDLGA
jgi:hypothetical protein